MPRLKCAREQARIFHRRVFKIRIVIAAAFSVAATSCVFAQSFDCTAAQSLVEKAICASPELIKLDLSLARLYEQSTEAAKSDASSLQRLRAAQRDWIGARDRACAPSSGNAARLQVCVADAYGQRIAALSVDANRNAQLPPAPPAPAASISVASVPASADGEALVTVTSAGRFSIRAASRTGVALQLVDMIAGPGDIFGDAGTRDGRADLLLDKGVYKLRTFGAKGAAGVASLTTEPFREAAPAAREFMQGGQTSAELADLQQRSYWVVVDAAHPLAVEAAGRSLQDLRAWRNGAELSELRPSIATIEPKPGRPLTRLRLEGVVEPGLYLVTAYGGAPQTWADGDASQPLHLRFGPPTLMAAGWFEGTLGPSGSQRFTVPAPASYFRLDLPEQAPARLTARRSSGGSTVATIAKNSREPVVAVALPTNGQTAAIVEVSGLEGQKFRLRALNPASSLRLASAGRYLLSVDVAGESADDVPATVVLARYQNGAGKVVVSDAPRVGPGLSWRRKFNLRGPTTLIFEITQSGAVAATTQGPGVRLTLDPLVSGAAPRTDGKTPQVWNVEAGWYVLKLDPVAGASGVIDLTFGQPGLTTNLSPEIPVRNVIDLGPQTLERNDVFQVFANSAPGLVLGPSARLLPADLATVPLSVQQPARSAIVAPRTPPAKAAPPAPRMTEQQKPKTNTARAPVASQKVATQRTVAAKPLPPRPAAVALPPQTTTRDGSLVIPVRLPVGGRLVATDHAGAVIESSVSILGVDKDMISAVVTIPPSDVARTVILAFVRNEVPVLTPVVGAENFGAPLEAGVAGFFNLQEKESRRFQLNVPEGGLYRLETLGRLKTNVSVSTAFLPRLAAASDNGPGRNALLQTYLRAGSYRVGVSTSESSGRLGLVAMPAGLIDTGVLVAGGSVRATLASGAGATIALDIDQAGDYRIDLYGVNKTFTARLEDSEGWPLMRPGPLETLNRRFEPGRYRLVVLPQDVDARLVARLRRIESAPPLVGHGPWPLSFGSQQAFQWREPASNDAARAPDRWIFELQGLAHVTLSVSDGMIGNLVEVSGERKPVGKITFKRDFAEVLPAGRYEVEAQALGRNDRLDYTISLRANELQPGQKRFVDLPASIPFAISQDRVVSFTTFGRVELGAILRDANGGVVERLAGRTDDWNIALSRLLPAGNYTIDLSGSKSAQRDSSESTADDEEPSPDARADAEGSADPDGIEIRLDLPATSPVQTLELAKSASARGPQIHQFALPAAPRDSLLVAGAQSTIELVLSLERRDDNGFWRAETFDRGRTPIVAVASDGGARPWRLSVWAIDGGAAEIRIGARSVVATAQAVGEINLETVAIDGLDKPLGIALARASEKSLLALKERQTGLLQGSRLGRPLAAAEVGPLVPQSEALWLVARGEATKSVRLETIQADANDIALDLAPGDIATLRSTPQPEGHQRIWRAFSTFGQPGLDAGRGFGVARRAAMAVAGDGPLRVWNAGADDALRLRVDSVNVAMRQTANVADRYAILLPPRSAQPVHLPAGAKQVRIDLSASTAAHLSDGAQNATVWANESATSRQFTGDWTRALLINTSDQPAPLAIEVIPATEQRTLAAGLVVKRFFGAAGSISLPVRAAAGDTLVTAGGQATFVGQDGKVAQGGRVAITGPGELLVDHPQGLVAAWIENATSSPWAIDAATPTNLPQIVNLSGQTKAFGLKPATAALVHARTSAPVIMALQQGAAVGAPELFPTGAELHRYLAAGDAELRLYSPQDGPLSGELELTATPVIEIGEGVGDPQALAPGATALFGFEVKRASNIGAGVRSDPERASARLLDASGKPIGEGVAQMHKLQPGRYLLEARAPASGETLVVRPAVVGLTPPDNGPPPDVAARYLELVGLSPASAR